IALEASPLLVLGSDDALAGGPELFDQPDRSQDQRGLAGEVLEQARLVRRQPVPVALADAQRPQQLVSIADREHVSPGQPAGQRLARKWERSRNRPLPGPG